MEKFDFKKLYDQYLDFKEKSIQNRLYKPEDIHRLIRRHGENSAFKLKQIGKSVEERPIYSLVWGNGSTHVLLWSQMHGDEPTATMAFMDLFNWLAANSEWDHIKGFIAEKLTIHFIPILNPDGAAKYQRRNAIDIDLNRDALRLQCPESKSLFKYREEIAPTWAFNMHDQRKYYTVGDSHETATVSFLAPSYDIQRSINEIREDAMKVIVCMNDMLQKFIPGKIAKYTDKYYPRSFGDNFQKFGVRSILVESGGFQDDPEKQYIRKLHFCLLINGFYSICTEAFKNSELSSYHAIPENSEFLYDLIVRNATLSKTAGDFLVDLAYKTEDIAHEEHWDFYHQSSLEDLGDLSFHKGFNELDATGMKIQLGEVFPKMLDSYREKSHEDYLEMLRQGYTDIRVKNLPEMMEVFNLPIRFIPEHGKLKNELLVNTNPSIYLTKDGVKKYAIVNGFLIKL
jgi:hypothetical protein